MIDLSTIKIFLSSLAPIAGMHYQIWDNNGGVLFSTGKVIPPELPVEESQDLYSLVIDQKVFRYRLCNAHNFLGRWLPSAKTPLVRTEIKPEILPNLITLRIWKIFSTIW